MRGVLVLAALLVPAGASAGGPKPQPTRGPVTVFVTGKKAPKPPSAEELRAMKEKADRLAKQFDEMEKADRKQFGKKKEKWPPETRAAYYEALDAGGVATTDVWYASPSEPDKADSVEDVAKALGRDAKEPPRPGDETVDTTTLGWMSDMKAHVFDLGTRGATVSGQPAVMWLDLRVPPGGKAAAAALVEYGRNHGVTVVIKEFP